MLEAMGIEVTLFGCPGGSELDSSGVGSVEMGTSSRSELTGTESELDSTECGSTELETVVSGHVEDVPLRHWWPMNDDRLLTTLYGSRCALTDELVPINSFVVMRTHLVLVSLANHYLRIQC